MKATIVECVMGVFAFGESNELVEQVFFPKDPKETAKALERIKAGKIVDEIAKIVKRLQTKGYATFVFESSEMAQNAQEKFSINVDVAKPSEAGETLRRNLGKFAVDTGFADKETELSQWTHRVSMELTKMRVRKAVEKRDLVVIQVIQTIDDLDRTLNIFSSRVREWYGLHFPELDRLVENHETYARLVADLGEKENFTVKNLKKQSLPKAKAKHIIKAAETSMGAELDEGDTEQLRNICKNTLSLYDVRQRLEGYLESVMGDVAPNIRALAGPLLGARLIALAGGLNNIAKMPASTIQLLGAEKALFRALKTGTRPPKHGIIFQHSLIQEAKRWQRGKVARALAGKLAIAARTDAFSGKYTGDSLQLGLEKRISEIKEQHAVPPPKRRRTERPHRRKKRGRKD
jgi:nucleolar protein 56